MSIFKRKRVYLDNAALTPTDPRVLKEMVKYYSPSFGNPSSIHKEGVLAQKALTTARKTGADFLHALPDEIIFTASGTEANNLAVLGVIKAQLSQEPLSGNHLPQKQLSDLHMIVSAIEHPSVLETALDLQKQGMMLDVIGVDEMGIVNLKELKEKIRKETCFISIMMVNNEIGTLQPIKEIAKIIRHTKQHIIFHTDASQAPLYLELNVRELGVDLLTLDSHKVYGPKGVGLLFKKRGTELSPLILGGGQEDGLRSGTQNIPGIMGLTYALKIAAAEQLKEVVRISELRNYFIESLIKMMPDCVLNGHVELRIANNVNISLPGVQNEFLVLQLDAKGIACSTKSSCLRDEDESYVLKALGEHKKDAVMTSLRFSLGRNTQKKDIDYVLKILYSLRQTH